MPPVVRHLQMAMEWRRQLDAGEVPSQAQIACQQGISRARVSQILALLRLAPEIRECILAATMTTGTRISEHRLRHLTQIPDGRAQLESFLRMVT